MRERLSTVLGGPYVVDADRRLAALRILVCGYATVWTTVRAPHLLDTIDFEARRLQPVGLLAWIDQPLPPVVVVAAVVITPMVGLAAALGVRYRLTGPALAVGFLVITTYRNSWGQIFHTEHLVALHLIALAVAPADRHWSIGPTRARRPPADGRWAVDAMAVMTVCTYFVAGVAKLRNGGWSWVDGDVILHQVSFDNARKDLLGDTTSPFAAVLVEQAWLTGPAAWGSMIVELGAPLALVGSRVARLWSGAAWGFHVAILVFMAILFPYHLLAIAMAPLLPVENLFVRRPAWDRLRGLRGHPIEPLPSSATRSRGPE